MSARLLATFCLLNLVVQTGWADSDGPANSEIVVYLRQDPGQPARPVEHMKREFTHTMLSAGYRIEWLSGSANTDASTLVVVDLRGPCGVTSGNSPAAPAATSDLASTAVSEGEVLPFSSINCGNLTRALGTSLIAEAGARRDFLYGRAMARVLAHEMYHILANTTDHARDGVAKPCFTARDLVTERFEFEHSTLAKLRPRPVDVPVDSAGPASGELATGR